MRTEKYELQQRLKAIELLAYWEGRLITPKLVSWFGISRQQASKDIKYYLQAHNPDSLVHDPAVKAYIPTAGFGPVLTTGHINEYMSLIAGFNGDGIEATLETDDSIVGVQLPDRSVRPEVVREVIKASRAGKSIKIIYASMNNPNLHERVISPHTLVCTGFRWHVRAYCHLRNEFRDFILSRIDRTPQPVDAPGQNTQQDKDWNEKISITLVPNAALSSQQQALVEKDYGMPDGRLQLSIRKALAHYTLHRYQAAITAEEANNAKQFPLQLMASDRAKLNPYLFSTNREEAV